MKSVYMAVTADEYELPVACEDTVTELSRKLNVPANSIYSGLSRGDSGKGRGFKFIKVDLEE